MNTKEKIAVMQHYEDGGEVKVTFGLAEPYITSKSSVHDELKLVSVDEYVST